MTPRKNKIKLPLDKFRIRLPYAKNNRFVDVYVWDTKKSLQKHTKEKPDIEGLFHPAPYKIYPRKYVPKRIGDIHYHKGKIGIGVVSHEVAHSAVHIFHALGLDIVDKHNEAFCHYIGYVIRKIYNRFISKNYYD